MLTVDINFCFTFDLLEDTYILASTQRILAIGAIRTLGFFLLKTLVFRGVHPSLQQRP